MAYRKVYEITGYTFDTSTYCVECTYNHFLEADLGPIDYGRVHFDLDNPNIVDSKGNSIRPIFLGDEFDYQPCCDDCFEKIDCSIIWPNYCGECGQGSDNEFCSQACLIDYQTWLAYTHS